MDDDKEFDIPAIYIVALLLSLVIGAFLIMGFRSYIHNVLDLGSDGGPVP